MMICVADYNRFGEKLTGVPVLRNKKWCISVDPCGWPIPDWKNNLKNSDDEGFDKHFSIETEFELAVGTRILRYSKENGIYSAPLGTKYECLTLPYKIETIMYNEFEVLKPFSVTIQCPMGYHVTKGIVAKGFDVVGGGIQYKHHRGLIADVRAGYLRKLEVYEWSPNIEEKSK